MQSVYYKVKRTDQFVGSKKPLEFEILEVKRTLNYFLESIYGEGYGLQSGWLTKTRRTIQVYNIYGRIVTKKVKGCSFL